MHVYIISSNHGFTACITHSAPCQSFTAIIRTAGEKPSKSWSTWISTNWTPWSGTSQKAKDLLIEHNTKLKQCTCHLLLCMLSMEDSGRNHHLEVCRWQGCVRAYIWRFSSTFRFETSHFRVLFRQWTPSSVVNSTSMKTKLTKWTTNID